MLLVMMNFWIWLRVDSYLNANVSVRCTASIFRTKVLGFISQLVDAYGRGVRHNVWMAGAGEKLIFSDRFSCVSVCG